MELDVEYSDRPAVAVDCTARRHDFLFSFAAVDRKIQERARKKGYCRIARPRRSTYSSGAGRRKTRYSDQTAAAVNCTACRQSGLGTHMIVHSPLWSEGFKSMEERVLPYCKANKEGGKRRSSSRASVLRSRPVVDATASLDDNCATYSQRHD